MDAYEFPVTARRIGPSSGDLTTPRVFYLKSDDIEKISPNRGAKGGAVIFMKKYAAPRKVEVFETPDEVRVAMGATGTAISADPYVGALVDLAVTGVTGGVTTTAVLTKYLSKYTSATGVSAIVRLPPPSDRNTVVIVNGTSAPVSVFPNGASGYIDSGASGASKILPAFQRLHFATAPTTGNGASAVWKTALDAQ